MDLALARTGARNGAIFLWDAQAARPGRQLPRRRGAGGQRAGRADAGAQRRPPERRRAARLQHATSRTWSTTPRAIRTTRPTSSTCSRSRRCRFRISGGPSACSASRRASGTRSAPRAPRRARGAGRVGGEVPAPRAALLGDAQARGAPSSSRGCRRSGSRSSGASSTWRSPTRRCWSPARAAPARSWSPTPSTSTAGARRSRS